MYQPSSRLGNCKEVTHVRKLWFQRRSVTEVKEFRLWHVLHFEEFGVKVGSSFFGRRGWNCPFSAPIGNKGFKHYKYAILMELNTYPIKEGLTSKRISSKDRHMRRWKFFTLAEQAPFWNRRFGTCVVSTWASDRALPKIQGVDRPTTGIG